MKPVQFGFAAMDMISEVAMFHSVYDGNAVAAVMLLLIANVLDRKSRPIFTFTAFFGIFVSALIGGGIGSLGCKANLLGTFICLCGAMLVTSFKEITIKRAGPPQHLALHAKAPVFMGLGLRNSRRRFVLIIYVMMMIIAVAAAVNNTETISSVGVGDKLPPDCEYVLHCGIDCLSCSPTRGRPGFNCCS